MQELMCRRCKEAAEIVLVQNKPHSVRCPVCGLTADYDKTKFLAAKHFGRNTVHQMLKKSFRGSKFVTLKSGKSGNPIPDFILYEKR